MVMDILAVGVIIAITLIVYSFTKDRALLAVINFIYVYLGLAIMSTGLGCTASFLCHTSTTFITSGSTLAFVLFVGLTFGALINIYAEFSSRGSKNGK